MLGFKGCLPHPLGMLWRKRSLITARRRDQSLLTGIVPIMLVSDQFDGAQAVAVQKAPESLTDRSGVGRGQVCSWVCGVGVQRLVLSTALTWSAA